MHRELLNQICVRLEVAEFNLTKAIISDQDQVIWESIGLPTDVQAIENAAILTKVCSNLYISYHIHYRA